MVRNRQERNPGLTRRSVIATAGAFGLLGLCVPAPAATRASRDPVARYMTRVAARLQTAARKASPSAFLSVLRRHADVPGIALYSLGRYRSHLRSSRRRSYYNGVAKLVANYFADQTRQYKVVKVEMGDRSWRAGKHYMIDSKVTLKSGSQYRVRWRLVRRRNGFKVIDVRVVGFWLRGLLRSEFERFMKKRGGNIRALLAALARQ